MKFKHFNCSSSIVKFIPLLLLTVLTTSLQAANLTSETEVFSPDSTFGDRFGVAMAIASVESNTMVIGAESADIPAESGVAYVFTRTGAGQPWGEVAKLTPSDGTDSAFYGASVAISPDGGTIVIGALNQLTYDDPLDNPDLGPAPTGIVYVYVKGAGAWADATETVQLHPSDPFDNDRFGKSVAIGGGTDGDEIIAVGAESVEIANDNANGDGLIYVFDKPTTAGGWGDWSAVATVPQVTPPTFTSAELARLRPSDEGGTDHFHLGGSLAISEAGDVIVAGTYWWGETIGVDEDSGTAYVFVKPTVGAWVDATETAFLQPTAPVLFEEMGRSIAIDKAGDTVVVGAPSPGGSTPGSVYVFTKPGSDWSNDTTPNETARLTASDGAAGDMFGNSVFISRGTAGDEKIIVGAPFTPYSEDPDFDPNTPPPPAIEVGGAYVFDKPAGGGTWVTATETDRLSADSLRPDDRFGYSVVMTSDETGNAGLLVGAPERDRSPIAGGTNSQDIQTGSFYRTFIADVDLSVAKSVQGGGTDFPVSTNVVFDLLVTNNSSITNATGVTLVDTLPTELTYVSDTGTCSNNAGTVTCNIGQILAGANTTISITATTAATVATNVTNTATVSGTEPDGTPANDTSSVSINITNAAPTASAVTITDANGGSAVVGDVLNGNYTYADAENDLEGTSTFRWLRGGVAITGATANTYTTVVADGGQNISFEVTPVALTGSLTGTAVVSPTIAVLSNAAPTATAVTVADDNGGSVIVGDQLTGGYTYADAETDLEGTSTFRWLRGAAAIAGATGNTYTLVAADSGQNISFEVTPVAATGTTTGTAVASSTLAVVNSVPAATAVTITDDNAGSVIVGDQLTGGYTYGDLDNDAEGTSTFRWLRGAAAIAGATGNTYTLVAADSGQNISFEVTPVAATGTTTGTAVASSTLAVVNSVPAATAVTITDDNAGSVIVGDQLTGGYTYGDLDNDAEGTSTFRWLRGAAAIAGATGNTYTLVAADSGQNISFEVTPVAATGTTTGTAVASSTLAVVNSAPTATTVAITDANGGSAVVGDTLNATYVYGDLDNDLEGASTIRWLRNGALIAGTAGTTNAAIGSSYTLVAADSGQSITFEVTPVSATGTSPGTLALSNAIAIINSAPTATGVSITDDNGGSIVVGDQLTGNFTHNDVDGDAAGTSTFRWLRGGTAITGATANTYTLVVADSGADITFEVTPVSAAGTSPGTAVVSSAITVVNSAPTATGVGITDANGGTVIVGDILNGTYTFADLDSDAEGTSTFRWLRGAVAVATTQNYTLVAADSGQNMTFEVTPVAATGVGSGTAVSSSAVAVVNSAPTATTVAITDANGGSAVVGDVLNATYTFNDLDGDLEGASTVRWLRNGALIAGTAATTNATTGSSYTLVAADSGQDISFEVTPVATTGTSPGALSLSNVIATNNSAPTATGVSITDDNAGSVVVGDQLTGNFTHNDVDGDAAGISTFRWLRDGAAITGATANTYTLVAADSGADITFEVTPVSGAGTNPGPLVVSAAVSVVNSVPTATGVGITDANGSTVIVGDILNGTYTFTDPDNDAEGTSTFRWLRGAVAVATTQNYTLVAADSGQNMTFEVTPVASTGVGSGTAVQSASVAVINSVPTVAAVVIADANGGSAVVGDVINATYTFNDLDGDLEGASTIRWLRNGALIAGTAGTTNATAGSSYTLVAADNSQDISFEVTPAAATGTSPGALSVSNVIATNNSAPTATGVSITDDNGGSVVVGDQLTGNFTHNDVDGDAAGTSTFRWLRGGAAITGATANTYTLMVADSGEDITFEVTPVSAAGTSPGAAVESSAVNIVNSAPIATAGGETVDEDASVAIILAGTDIDNDALTYTVVTQPSNGTLSGTAPNLTYNHDGSETTSDSFTFTVNDGIVDSAAATVTITVTPQPDAPVANGGSVVINAGEVAVIALDGSDADLDPITFNVIDSPANGTADLTGFSEVTYTPNPGFTGTDSFAFSVTDGQFTSSATVLISVFPSGAILPAPTGNGWKFDITTDIATTLGLDASVVGEVVISSEAPLALVVNPVVNLAIFSGDDVSPADSGFNYPLGLFDFAVATTGTVEVMLQLPSGVNIPAGAVVRKLDNTGTWVTLAAPTVVLDAPNGIITLTLTDNDSNDRDPAVGIIRDPVGLAVAEVTPPGGGGSSGGGSSGGGSFGSILPLMFLLSMLQIARQRRKYRG